MKVGQFIKDAKAIIKSGFTTVSHEQREARLKVCHACPNFNRVTLQCGVCTCFIPLKTLFEVEHCPVGKWDGDEPGAYVSEETRKARMDQCEACPKRSGRKCQLCTCDITKLTRISSSKCPLEKW